MLHWETSRHNGKNNLLWSRIFGCINEVVLIDWAFAQAKAAVIRKWPYWCKKGLHCTWGEALWELSDLPKEGVRHEHLVRVEPKAPQLQTIRSLHLAHIQEATYLFTLLVNKPSEHDPGDAFIRRLSPIHGWTATYSRLLSTPALLHWCFLYLLKDNIEDMKEIFAHFSRHSFQCFTEIGEISIYIDKRFLTNRPIVRRNWCFIEWIWNAQTPQAHTWIMVTFCPGSMLVFYNHSTWCVNQGL